MKSKSSYLLNLAVVFSMALAMWPTGVQATASTVEVAPPVQEESAPEALPAWMQPPPPSLSSPALQDDGEGPIVSEPVVPKLSPALRDLPTVALPVEEEQREINPLRNFFGAQSLEGTDTKKLDPLAPLGVNSTLDSPAPILSFEGMGDFGTSTPPDTTGD
ncbi:MAG: hypothetical protein V3S14_16210, partial [Anaerolineae bacterium]